MADNIREKLVEILKVPIYPHLDADPTEVVADYLLDNGVTIQEWIPVSESLPKQEAVYSDCESFKKDEATGEYIAIDPFTCYESKPVLVYGKCDGKEIRLIAASYCTWTWEGGYTESEWRDTALSVEVYGVTHWMPLPQPPKGE